MCSQAPPAKFILKHDTRVTPDTGKNFRVSQYVMETTKRTVHGIIHSTTVAKDMIAFVLTSSGFGGDC